MTPATKIILGAVATTVVAWWLHGPMGFGVRCLAEARLPAAVGVSASGEVPASAAVVANCQKGVDAAIAGKTVNFISGGAALAVDATPILDALGAALKDCAGTTVEVAGHTDRVGGAEANLALSQSRADAVKASLVAAGVPEARLVAKGYGETMPTSAAAPESNPADRRIQFSVATAPAAPAAPAAN